MSMQRVRFFGAYCLIFLLGFSLFSAKTQAAMENLSATPSSQQESEVNYDLPYPGLLPDSPLYFLRVIRDRVVSLMISDPLKKTEFDLLQADKRLNAGIFLFDKGKTALALSSVSKAENYFEQSLIRMEEARIQGRDINGVKGRLMSAVKRHVKELNNFYQKSDISLKKNFEKELQRVENFELRLSQ